MLARFLHHGDLSTWWLDEAAYSRAGAAAHGAAWRLGVARPDLVGAIEARMGAGRPDGDEAEAGPPRP